MSKGRDFRGPRKRGFDDDGPAPYEPRPSRPPQRGFGGGGFGGGPDMMASSPSSTAASVDAVVKWFKSDKGFGFVELSNGAGDAFLHIGALQSAGFETVPPGARLKVQVGSGAKGAQVTRVLEVDTAGAAERAPQRTTDAPRGPRSRPDPATAIQISGKVKWFDDTKGFGFVSSNDGGKDVFVHISILGAAGLSHLAEGQAVQMRVVDTPKGREALSIALG
ncbi:cold shock domain-containing protein [Lichenihabitans sp. Uapishka_5]|uniref:cold-shock protein n=1 Tax=Lichenihabitans sp. Uapishka_5 TaxID=3037302 RepID=UPI0029E81773|nr:cold shock domain-containing protein [Lichenihabitans sp. Uapishka_5]MDX7949862.1 cold shock domain-containing protein [Lichenihabitans sp. Uapishka_5]